MQERVNEAIMAVLGRRNMQKYIDKTTIFTVVNVMV